MKTILYLFLIPIFLLSCKTSKDYLARADNDKTIFEAVKAVKKNYNDSNAIKAIPQLYTLAQQRHLSKIKDYSTLNDLSKWNKIINEYGTLQKMYEAISESNVTLKLITPTNYQSHIYENKQQAAEEYYKLANALLQTGSKDDAKNAYQYFTKAEGFVPDFKQAKEKIKEAYQKTIISVVINPVQDNSFFTNRSWGRFGYNYSIEYLQETMVRELGAANSSRYPAKFYTDWEASSAKINPDWIIDLTLKRMDIPQPRSSSQSRNYSKRIEVARDTSGKIIYQTVNATVYTTRYDFTARIEMEVNISDAQSGKTIRYNTYNEDYYWQREDVTFNGDIRAIDNVDLYSRNRFNENPTNEFVLQELYRRIYPRVKNGIINAVDW